MISSLKIFFNLFICQLSIKFLFETSLFPRKSQICMQDHAYIRSVNTYTRIEKYDKRIKIKKTNVDTFFILYSLFSISSGVVHSFNFIAVDSLSRHNINSQCFVWGNISTGMALTGTKGSPRYCFELGRARSTRFFMAARGSHDMYTNLLRFFALRSVNKAF